MSAVAVPRRWIAIVVALTAVFVVAWMTLPGHGPGGRAAAAGAPASLHCSGATQGLITRGTTNGVKNTIPIGTASHEILVANGTRQHKLYRFSKATNDTSLDLTRAEINNESLSCTFRYYKPAPNGTPQMYLSVALKGARVIDYQFSHHSTETDSWSLTYQTITWTMNGKTLTDTVPA